MLALSIPSITQEMIDGQIKESGSIHIEATESDFWNLVSLPEYHLEYYNKHIIGTMSYGSTPHERIVRNMMVALFQLFPMPKFEVFGSNRPIYAEACQGIFLPDLHLISGALEEYQYDKTKTASLNPSVVVEVHSWSTRTFDLTEKLDCYQAMPSVNHIVYVETALMKVRVYSRTNKPNQWLSVEYKEQTQKVKIMSKYVSLNSIYLGVFEG